MYQDMKFFIILFPFVGKEDDERKRRREDDEKITHF